MTAEHDAMRDLVAAVALGAATPDETRQVQTHAEGCAVCREELDGLRTAVSELALSVPQHDPPARLKRAVMEAVRAEAPRPARRRWRPRLRLPALSSPWPAVAAALAALALVLVGWNVALQTGDEGSDVTAIQLRGTQAAPGVRGQVLYLRDQGAAVVRLSRLPQTGPGRGWELWAIRDGSPVSAGFMRQPGRGEALGATADLADVTALAVTQEPLTNTSAPTSDIVAMASVPSQG
jgi:anti-sigma-K factor RskA